MNDLEAKETIMSYQGAIAWLDLFVDDVNKAKTFYSELFNWSAQEMQVGEGLPPYTMFLDDDDNAFCGATKPEQVCLKNSWLAYIHIEDLNQTAEIIKANDGKVLFEKEMPGIGKWVVAQDNQGAIFAPFQAATKPIQDSLPQFPASLGKHCWHEYMANDYNKSFEFYQKIFAWQQGDAMDLGAMGTYQLYTWQDNPMGGMMNITAEMQGMQPTWVEYFHVTNVDDIVNRAQSLGGSPSFPAMDVKDGGRVAGIVDNQGVLFAVWQGAK
jgi:uncharacterized protein